MIKKAQCNTNKKTQEAASEFQKEMEAQKKQRIQEISSPTHEFSFAVSLDSDSQHPPLAVDLTPADDIFFRGHLLPLQLLSTNSFDAFQETDIIMECDKTRGHSFNSYEYRHNHIVENHEDYFQARERAKSKSFSLLRLGRRRKEEEQEAEDQGEKHKKKARFDMAHFLKRYIRIFSKERREDIQFRRKPYSFSSGKLSPREGRDLRARKGEFSAPASITTSRGNSGILMAASRGPLHHSNDSSMEELHAAIQAAIAHCKNSIAAS